MIKKENNYAFIDGNNLHLGIKLLGWQLDYKKFRTYLLDKYSINKAYYFIGFVPENTDIYNKLQSEGYILIFKDTFRQKDGNIKGNCDAELVLQAMIDFNNYDKAVLVTGDGDFSCLVKYLIKQHKFLRVISPNLQNSSYLLRRIAGGLFLILDGLKSKLEFTPKTEKPL